jgi:hypothetical protein
VRSAKEIGRPQLAGQGNGLRARIVRLLGNVPALSFATTDAQRLFDHLGAQGLTSTTIGQYLVLLCKVVMRGAHTGVLNG